MLVQHAPVLIALLQMPLGDTDAAEQEPLAALGIELVRAWQGEPIWRLMRARRTADKADRGRLGCRLRSREPGSKLRLLVVGHGPVDNQIALGIAQEIARVRKRVERRQEGKRSRRSITTGFVL